MRNISFFALAVFLGVLGPNEVRPVKWPAKKSLYYQPTTTAHEGGGGGFAPLTRTLSTQHMPLRETPPPARAEVPPAEGTQWTRVRRPQSASSLVALRGSTADPASGRVGVPLGPVAGDFALKSVDSASSPGLAEEGGPALRPGEPGYDKKRFAQDARDWVGGFDAESAGLDTPRQEPSVQSFEVTRPPRAGSSPQSALFPGRWDKSGYVLPQASDAGASGAGSGDLGTTLASREASVAADASRVSSVASASAVREGLVVPRLRLGGSANPSGSAVGSIGATPRMPAGPVPGEGSMSAREAARAEAERADAVREARLMRDPDAGWNVENDLVVEDLK